MDRYKVTERQVTILATLNSAHHNGMLSQCAEPFGVTGLVLAGSGAALTGLLKRGLACERNRLFYITEDGQIALSKVPPQQTVSEWIDWVDGLSASSGA
jgi:hypothetical protein